MWVQYASDANRDTLRGEVWTDDHHLVAEVYEHDGRWNADLWAVSVDPQEFIQHLQMVIDRLSEAPAD